MEKRLVIVFAKNIVLGKVKTRLAKTIGDNAAFEVYKHLIDITEQETLRLTDCDLRVYFSDVVIQAKWPNTDKFVQQGDDLGERMFNAFQDGFDDGYTHIIGVGADLPDLSAEIMRKGLEALQSYDTVFGPSEDGGYYLIGMNRLIPEIFENKPWSTDDLLTITLRELSMFGISYVTLNELNDVDTIEDLRNSSISARFKHLIN